MRLNQSIIAGTFTGVQNLIPPKSFAVLPMSCHFGHRMCIMRFARASFPFPRFFPNRKPPAFLFSSRVDPSIVNHGA
jgi:hypothetical protein